MGGLSPVHLIIVLVVALLVLGPGKLPETGAALGHAIRDFRNAISGDLDEVVTPSPATPAAPGEAVTSQTPPPDRA